MPSVSVLHAASSLLTHLPVAQDTSAAQTSVPATPFSPHRPQPEPPPAPDHHLAQPNPPQAHGRPQHLPHIPQTDGACSTPSEASPGAASAAADSALIRLQSNSANLHGVNPPAAGPSPQATAAGARTAAAPDAYLQSRNPMARPGCSHERAAAGDLTIPQSDGVGDGGSQGSGASRPGKPSSQRIPLSLTPSKQATGSRATGAQQAGTLNETEADSRPYSRRYVLCRPINHIAWVCRTCSIWQCWHEARFSMMA